jgi:hypothetical protein
MPGRTIAGSGAPADAVSGIVAATEPGPGLHTDDSSQVSLSALAESFEAVDPAVTTAACT